MWDLELISDAAASAIQDAARAADLEQSPLGVDALAELATHALLAGGLARTGFGVLREQRYPSNAHKPRRTEGERCDFVLTPQPKDALNDPLAGATLFAGQGLEPDRALWIEVKVVGQFSMVEGVSRPNPGYSGRLLGEAMADVRKLSAEPAIAWAALLLLIFSADRTTLEHDLAAWTRRAIDGGLPISAPIVRTIEIADRIGNSVCGVAVARVHHL